ncbi:MAG: hypothetical protein A2147_09055 [Chloroflexi bacterium RBG_16_57_8]|nr:MAG: hypothetical protein A2147_09055 [Chloroflexi bacterium RBG_16_57_8]
MADDPNTARTIALLQEGEIAACRPVYSGSNSVFLVGLSRNGEERRAIYKPRRGEAPLWDFPDGTLFQREFAAYLVSQALGWRLVPPTVIRGGPYGVGVVQLFVRATYGDSYPSLAETHAREFRRIAAFDLLVNNADRKAGHCLQGEDGRIWGIDHGLTFHEMPKLRTVLWEFAGQRIPDDLLDDLRGLRRQLEREQPLHGSLSRLLSAREVEALQERLKTILQQPAFPSWSGSYHSIPWPPF